MAKSLGQVMSEMLQNYGIAQRVQEFQALNLWPEVAGQKIAAVTKARDVRDGRLYVEVSNSAWRNELYYLKAQIIEELNKKVGTKIIHDILFV